MLDEGANIDAPDRHNVRPVVAAARHGRHEAVSLLLDRKAKPSLDSSDTLLLSTLAAQGWTYLVARLLDADVPLDICDASGETVLHKAVIARPDLGDSRTEKQKDEDCATVVRLLLERGARIDPASKGYYFTPLFVAAWNGSTRCVRELLSAGAEVEGNPKCDMTPLWMAAHWQHLEIVRLLLDAGADTESRDGYAGRTPLAATLTCHETYSDWGTPVALLLLDRGANALAAADENEGRTILHDAAHYGSVEVVRALIARGVLINGQDWTGTPLHAVAHSYCGDYDDCARVLLQAGADPNARNKTGATPLYEAVKQGNLAVAEALLSHSARVDIPAPKRGKPILFHAIDRGVPEFCDLLLAAGAAPNAPDKRGRTALHHAATNGNTAVVRVLLAGGANPTMRDQNGQTPLDLARARKRIRMTALLEKVP